MVEDVVELGAELHFEALNRCGELLIQGQVSLIEGGCTAWVAGGVADWAQVIAGSILDGRQDEGIQVDVVDIAGIGGAILPPVGDGLTGDDVRSILVCTELC